MYSDDVLQLQCSFSLSLHDESAKRRTIFCCREIFDMMSSNERHGKLKGLDDSLLGEKFSLCKGSLFKKSVLCVNIP